MDAARPQLHEHLAVVGLFEKMAHTSSHRGAHIAHLKQIVFAGLEQGIELTKMQGEVFGGSLPHMPNPQRINEARQGGGFGRFKG